MKSNKQPLESIQTPSTAIVSDVRLVHDGGSVSIQFEFDRDSIVYSGGIQFFTVRAHRWRAESHCTQWHIEDAYDTVVLVERSAWVDELVRAQESVPSNRWNMNHYMIYLDSAGAFEVVADSFSVSDAAPVLGTG